MEGLQRLKNSTLSRDLSELVLSGEFSRTAREISVALLLFSRELDEEQTVGKLIESLKFLQVDELRSEQITYMARAFKQIAETKPHLLKSFSDFLPKFMA